MTSRLVAFAPWLLLVGCTTSSSGTPIEQRAQAVALPGNPCKLAWTANTAGAQAVVFDGTYEFVACPEFCGDNNVIVCRAPDDRLGLAFRVWRQAPADPRILCEAQGCVYPTIYEAIENDTRLMYSTFESLFNALAYDPAGYQACSMQYNMCTDGITPQQDCSLASDACMATVLPTYEYAAFESLFPIGDLEPMGYDMCRMQYQSCTSINTTPPEQCTSGAGACISMVLHTFTYASFESLFPIGDLEPMGYDMCRMQYQSCTSINTTPPEQCTSGASSCISAVLHTFTYASFESLFPIGDLEPMGYDNCRMQYQSCTSINTTPPEQCTTMGSSCLAAVLHTFTYASFEALFPIGNLDPMGYDMCRMQYQSCTSINTTPPEQCTTSATGCLAAVAPTEPCPCTPQCYGLVNLTACILCCANPPPPPIDPSFDRCTCHSQCSHLYAGPECQACCDAHFPE